MLTIGLLGIGLDTYWPQFAGLKDRLTGLVDGIGARLTAGGDHVVAGGQVDSSEAALTCAATFQRAGVDIILLHVSTYAVSGTVLPLVQRVGVPVLVLGLQPTPALDCIAINALGDRGAMTGAWLANCQACSLPELACVFRRAHLPFRLVSGWIDDPEAWARIGEWLTAARVKRGMRDNRLGVLGRPYDGMLDVYADLTLQTTVFGTQTAILEMDELADLRAHLKPAEVAAMRARLEREFTVDPTCQASELDRAAATAAALQALVERHRLGSLAYYYESVDGHPNRDLITSIIPGNTLLTANHVPVAGEFEVRNAQAMKILDLAGHGGSFSEFYGIDFPDDVVLLGHDGPGHAAIAEERVRLVPLPVFHGKPGSGLSIAMRVRHGAVTLLSVVQDGEGRLSLLVAEGEAVPGPTLDIGNTNSRYRFSIGARAFIEGWSAAGPAHHVAIGTGRQASWIARLADLLGITCTRIC